MNEISELIGVYHADGGLVGEARYVIGKLLGTAHCALCDVTHSPVRRKPAWDAVVARIGIPFTLLHLNELDKELAGVVAATGSPVVLQRTASEVSQLLSPDTLETLGGSVEAFEQALRAAVGISPASSQ
jgi:hypothetical protein